ncbi:response regulator [Corallococcus coralloides]|uniref:response regulator n=1 Tax=Corallococcus coralloides TaxID=184914 RepID=UPI000A05E6D3|nr:response regulator [Corallococcus coralloides]
MKILIIEDDLNKLQRISELIRERAPDAQVTERKSYQSGLKEALKEHPDLIVLDMSMPTYDISPTEKGGRTRPYAGREILSELKRKHVSSRVVVVTQFESFGEGVDAMTLSQLKAQLRADHAKNYLTTVYYHPSETGWRDNLIAAMSLATKTREQA